VQINKLKGDNCMILKKISDNTNRIIELICICIFSLLLISADIQVFTRYIMNSSLSWTEEIARFAFIWLTMLGASIALKNQSHAVISIVLDHMPKKIRKGLNIIIDLLILFFCVIMIIQGIRMAILTKDQPSPAVHIPMAYIYISVSIGGLSMFFYKLWDLYRHIIQKITKSER